ncbi:hypothetical protein ACIPLC_37475 [Kitasatospora sp. NPDC086801]|uniref:hypothetical protein n=1 Tax=Kitasatospora sp. NPDC086801 TaxID=3364066 RepID=UPI0037F95161
MLDDPADVERTAAAPDPAFRQTASADHWLAPTLAVDPDGSVRHLARTNPALPPRDLVPLLLDPRRVGTAAQNPAIPTGVPHRMAGLAITHAAAARGRPGVRPVPGGGGAQWQTSLLRASSWTVPGETGVSQETVPSISASKVL